MMYKTKKTTRTRLVGTRQNITRDAKDQKGWAMTRESRTADGDTARAGTEDQID